MSNQIKVEFYQHENFVCGRVLEMPEEIRGTGIIIEDDNFTIQSKGFPNLYSTSLYLKGTNVSLDKSWFAREFTSTKEAEYKVKCFRNLIYKYNQEHLLTKKEREYLLSVIEPFKDRINYIRKTSFQNNYEQLTIGMTSEVFGLTSADIIFPAFPKGTMYQGLHLNTYYSLRSLNLEDENNVLD